MTTTIEISEAQAFIEALDRVPPAALTACEGWTVHDITAHVAAGADEIARLLERYGEGLDVGATRAFEEREAPYRAMDDAALRRKLFEASARMASAMRAVKQQDPDAVIPFTGRQMSLATFEMHGRSEAALHRWDMVGDDETSWALLSRPELTKHAVTALGPLLLMRGCGASPSIAPFSARLRTEGQLDVVVRREAAQVAISLEADDGSPALVADAAARLLFIWGRRPGDPSRIRADLPGEDRRLVRSMLAGF